MNMYSKTRTKVRKELKIPISRIPGWKNKVSYLLKVMHNLSKFLEACVKSKRIFTRGLSKETRKLKKQSAKLSSGVKETI